MKRLRLALYTCIVWIMPIAASAADQSPANWQAIDAYSQDRPPRLFRQHCKFDATGATQYCAAECGSGYQFYYCSEKSFGCCHVGVGYCDWNLSLRCSSWRWTW